MKRIFSILLILAFVGTQSLYADNSAFSGSTTQNPWKSSGVNTYYDTGKVAVGTSTFIEDLTVNGTGVIALKETTAPSNTASYGKLYVKASTGVIYFKDSSGVEYDLTAGGGGGGAPVNATYLLVTAHGSLPNARTILPSGAGTGLTITDSGAGGTLTWSIGNDQLKDTMIDWGVGAGQVDADDIPDGITNKFYTDAKARLALTSSATGLTYTNTTGVFTLSTGYVIPSTTEQTNWTTAYTNRVDTWTAPLAFGANVASITQAGVASNGYLSSVDWGTFNGKENVLTFSTGLTRAVNTVTSDIATGKSGGQTIYGGTGASEGLTVQSTTNGTRGYITLVDETLVQRGLLDVGSNGYGGSLSLYAEQGATDYLLIVKPNAAMTASYTIYFPAAVAGSNDLALISSTGGVLSYNDQALKTTSAVTFTTVDTGQGANELYDMDQNVLTTSSVVFADESIKGTTGGFKRKFSEATATLTGANTVIQVNVPAGAKLLGVQLRVDTLITSGDGGTSWAADFSGGSTTAICTAQAFTQNVKANLMLAGTEILGSEADITIDCNAAYTFSGGVVRAIVYYEEITTMGSV